MKRPITVLSLTAGGIALACAALVLAAPANDRLPISVADLEARGAVVFASVDADGDGLISAGEFMAHTPKFDRRAQGGHHGKPGHGKSAHGRPGYEQGRELDETQRQAHIEELATRRASMDSALFAALDENADSVLSADEFSSTAMAAARQSLQKHQQFERLDANQDGMLTPDEFPPRRLAALDADANGEISRDELKSGHRRFHHQAPVEN